MRAKLKQLITRFIPSAPRRELYLFVLYRVLEAIFLTSLLFSPLADALGADSAKSPIIALGISVFYLALPLLMLVLGPNERRLQPIVILGALVDITLSNFITHALPETTPGIVMLLLFSVAAACAILPPRWGNSVAVIASLAHITEYFVTATTTEPSRTLNEALMFSISYLAVGLLAAQIGQRARRSLALAEKRSAEVANLVEINELIIRRMRTGVLVVDSQGRIKLCNESTVSLLGTATEDPNSPDNLLHNVSPELAQRLSRWRSDNDAEISPLTPTPEQPNSIQPRFARLLAGSDLSLIFLDDGSIASRHAESLTLATLGRFSASLAHEIRNPLTAINYATQLLNESPHLDKSDHRLLNIIHKQCQRTNGIVENVLSLARRKPAAPEYTDLNTFAEQFVAEYQQTMPIETDNLQAITNTEPVIALVSPPHLHQIVTVLVHNALNYGRHPGEPADIHLRISQKNKRARIDIIDHGPGVPAHAIDNLFKPFFTTSEHGTGLGLYIASELCRANQSTLEYLPTSEGESRFRITMPGPDALQAEKPHPSLPPRKSRPQ